MSLKRGHSQENDDDTDLSAFSSKDYKAPRAKRRKNALVPSTREDSQVQTIQITDYDLHSVLRSMQIPQLSYQYKCPKIFQHCAQTPGTPKNR